MDKKNQYLENIREAKKRVKSILINPHNLQVMWLADNDYGKDHDKIIYRIRYDDLFAQDEQRRKRNIKKRSRIHIPEEQHRTNEFISLGFGNTELSLFESFRYCLKYSQAGEKDIYFLPWTHRFTSLLCDIFKSDKSEQGDMTWAWAASLAGKLRYNAPGITILGRLASADPSKPDIYHALGVVKEYCDVIDDFDEMVRCVTDVYGDCVVDAQIGDEEQQAKIAFTDIDSDGRVGVLAESRIDMSYTLTNAIFLKNGYIRLPETASVRHGNDVSVIKDRYVGKRDILASQIKQMDIENIPAEKLKAAFSGQVRAKDLKKAFNRLAEDMEGMDSTGYELLSDIHDSLLQRVKTEKRYITEAEKALGNCLLRLIG